MYYYRARSNPFAYRKPVNKKIPVKVTEVSADAVWAAAATADRVNGGQYYKEKQYNDQQVTHDTNRAVMMQALTDNLSAAEDAELGRAARAWHRGNLLLVALKRPLSEFEATLQKAAEMDTFALEVDRLEIATIASQIRAYRVGAAAEQKMWATDTTPLAPVGVKVECEVEVVKAVYSTNYGIYFATAVTTSDRKVLRFSHRSRLDAGQVINIKGRVKAHGTDGTQLNYVKVV